MKYITLSIVILFSIVLITIGILSSILLISKINFTKETKIENSVKSSESILTENLQNKTTYQIQQQFHEKFVNFKNVYNKKLETENQISYNKGFAAGVESFINKMSEKLGKKERVNIIQIKDELLQESQNKINSIKQMNVSDNEKEIKKDKFGK